MIYTSINMTQYTLNSVCLLLERNPLVSVTHSYFNFNLKYPCEKANTYRSYDTSLALQKDLYSRQDRIPEIQAFVF